MSIGGHSIGFPAGATDKTELQKAIWNHFGTAGSGTWFRAEGIGGVSVFGFGGPIPPRPFITTAMFKFRRHLRAELRTIAKHAASRAMPLEIGLRLLGDRASAAIKDEIVKGTFAPNSPLTIRIKGSSRPLMRFGDMRRAVTYQLVQGTSARAHIVRISSASR